MVAFRQFSRVARRVNRARVKKRRVVVESLEARTLLSTAQGIDLGDYYVHEGVQRPLLRAVDQLVIGLEPGTDGSVVASLTSPGGPLVGFTAASTFRPTLWMVTRDAASNEAIEDQYQNILDLGNLVRGRPGISFVTEGLIVRDLGDRVAATNEIIVALGAGVQAGQVFIGPMYQSYRPLAGTPDQFVVTLNHAVGTVANDFANALSNAEGVVWASPDFFFNPRRYNLNDPLLSQQWHLNNTGQSGATPGADARVFGAWDFGATGEGVVIAIVDDGVDYMHQDLFPNAWQNPGEIPGNGIDDDGNGWVDDVFGWDFLSGDNNPTVDPGDAHGTAVAGVAAARGNNNEGVSGAAYMAQIMSIRFLGSGTTASIVAESIYYASGRTRDGSGTWKAADILNHSWGGPDLQVTTDAFNWSATNGRNGLGAVNFAASGNSGTGTVGYPASIASTIAVGGSTDGDVRVSYSQFGSALDFVAPTGGWGYNGIQNIVTTDVRGSAGYDPGDYTNLTTTGFSGTSSACPLASGVGALILHVNPNLTWLQVRDLMRETADKIGGVTYDSGGFNIQYGYGRINAEKAVEKISAKVNLRFPTNLTENQTYTNVAIGEIVFGAPPADPSQISAQYSVDGGPSQNAVLTNLGGGVFRIRVPTLSFQEGGPHLISVVVLRQGSPIANASGNIIVIHLPINAFGVAISSTPPIREGDPFEGLIATFIDTDPDPFTADSYSVDIQWGDDGTSSPGTLVQIGFNAFEVYGSHIFAGGNSVIITRVIGPGTNIATAISTVSVIDSPLHSTGINVNPIEGSTATLALAHFTDEDPRRPGVNNYFASINWGDGTQSTGTIIADPINPGFYVTGNHAYNWRATPYPITVTIGNHTGDSTTVATGTAQVIDAPLSGIGFTYSTGAGQNLTRFFAAFQDADKRNHPVGHYQSLINWGDGSSSAGQIVVNSDGGYLVRATHAYRVAGTYQYSVLISNAPAPATTTVTGQVLVSPSPIAVEIVTTAAPVETQPFTDIIARFTTSNAIALPGDFTATISWGDNTVTNNAEILTDPAGGFLVRGSNKIYDTPGSYSVTVFVATAGAQAGAAGTINVKDAPLHSTGVALPVMESKTLFTNLILANFTDEDPAPNIGDFTATINWGDGTASTPGQIVPDGTGGFLVLGSHAFARPGQYPFTVNIVSRFGSRTTATGSANITAKIFPISGNLTPENGPAYLQGVTSGANPIFAGTSEPGATVSIFAARAGQAPRQVATALADPAGNWSTAASTLSDGSYIISASAVDALGVLSSVLTQILPHALTVDSVGPRVHQILVQPNQGRVQVTLKDDGSGLLASALRNPANYSLLVVGARSQKLLSVASINLANGASGTQDAVLTFRGLNTFARGSYVIQLRSSGVTDVAGNMLDERFYVPFPGVYAKSGQNYVAQFDTDGNRVSPLRQFIPPEEIQAARRFRGLINGRVRPPRRLV